MGFPLSGSQFGLNGQKNAIIPIDDSLAGAVGINPLTDIPNLSAIDELQLIDDPFSSALGANPFGSPNDVMKKLVRTSQLKDGPPSSQKHVEFLEQNPFAVRLKSLSNNATIAFQVSPEISETRNATYRTIDPIHMPGAIQVYTNTSARTWSMSGIRLISRNGNEAEENLKTVNVLRSWMMPFFGSSKTQGRDNYGHELIGAPPEVLQFSAYSDTSGSGVTNVRKVPVVMTNLNIPYPTDVDYIKTADTNQPFPAVMSIDVVLVETHSPREFSQFDLIDYREGNLPGF